MAIDLNDKTSNGNTLTNSSATEETTSLPFANSTIAVDVEAGSSQYLYAADSASLSITGNMTIEAWVNFESFSSNTMTVVGKYHTGTNQQSYIFFYDGVANLLYIGIASNGSNVNFASVSWTPTLSTWYHIAVVYTAAGGTADFYVNGVPYGTQQSGLNTSIYNGTERVGIGCLGATGGASGFFDGKIDEVRIWNTARTSAQIIANYGNELSGSESGLAAYWPFESTLDPATTTQYLKERYHNREDMSGYSLG